MGFFDELSKAAENQRIKKEARRKKLYSLLSSYQSKSDNDLKKIIQSTGFFTGASEDEKMVARKVLRDRGY